jgi:erythromycin esterase-like protein/uncharacterized RDD family membrane protein YckC
MLVESNHPLAILMDPSLSHLCHTPAEAPGTGSRSRGGEPTIAPWQPRAAAFLLDAVLPVLPLLVVQALSRFRAVCDPSTVTTLLPLTVAFLLQGWLAQWGTSFGQAMARLELHGRKGDRSSWPRTFLRNMIAFGLWIPILGDRMLDTHLVAAEHGPIRRRAGLGGSVVAAFGLATVAAILPLGPDGSDVAALHDKAVAASPEGFAALVGKSPGVRLVALGEASHGDGAALQLRVRFTRHLVERMGFRVLILEAGFTEVLALDRWVLDGQGDPKAILPGLGYWTLGTEDLLGLLCWARAWNEDPAHPEKVRIMGCDLPDPGRAGNYIRDRVMAEKVLWIMDHAVKGAKAVLWAHNCHVSKAGGSLQGADPMGAHLKRTLGEGMFILGFAARGGACLAYGPGGLMAFPLGPALPGSLEHGLGRTGRERFLLDLASESHGLPGWLEKLRPAHCIGAVWDGSRATSCLSLVPSRHFDALAYLDQATPVRLLPRP